MRLLGLPPAKREQLTQPIAKPPANSKKTVVIRPSLKSCSPQRFRDRGEKQKPKLAIFGKLTFLVTLQ
jgi:hypothetical protein